MRQLQFGLLGAFLSIVVHPVDAQRAQFRHVVLIVQENRTPDNIFGSNPTFEKGVDIATSGVNSHGKVIALTAEPLASCYDIDHSHEGFEDTLNYGANRDMIINNNPDCIVPANPQYKFAAQRLPRQVGRRLYLWLSRAADGGLGLYAARVC